MTFEEFIEQKMNARKQDNEDYLVTISSSYLIGRRDIELMSKQVQYEHIEWWLKQIHDDMEDMIFNLHEEADKWLKEEA